MEGFGLEVRDVLEHTPDEVKPPSFPTPANLSATGFPAPKKRVSAFKKQRQNNASILPSPPVQYGPERPPAPEVSEKQRIAEENDALLDSLSPGEIMEEQRDLFKNLDPKLIQMLLRRANLDDAGPAKFDAAPTTSSPSANTTPAATTNPPKVTVEDVSEDTPPPLKKDPLRPKKTVTFDEDAAPPSPPPTLVPARSIITSDPNLVVTPANAPDEVHAFHTHYPQPPTVPDLDPEDPDFLEKMHSKFFPSLPADPSKLAWMAPIPTPDSTADRESPYYPGQDSLPVSALRFDFRGLLIPPRLSRQIPVTKGLHHHGEAPEAAGYTIPELARYARSEVPAQRCIAYQTLGRMLYRLGRGDWGKGEGGRVGEEDDLAFGLWRCFKENRVVESIEEEVQGEEGRGHRSCYAYATEALWLFEKGGWKERWRGM
ncbi:RPAP1-like protein [Triangularia setosa]|uniref:RPAP1-like protein n=1 Tax=Triangularia setosa TaxID=2587417 RepID=A0AAN7A8M0_9PEZI|nr:RPAP1-like protein [Podospora setosa]